MGMSSPRARSVRSVSAAVAQSSPAAVRGVTHSVHGLQCAVHTHSESFRSVSYGSDLYYSAVRNRILLSHLKMISWQGARSALLGGGFLHEKGALSTRSFGCTCTAYAHRGYRPAGTTGRGVVSSIYVEFHLLWLHME